MFLRDASSCTSVVTVFSVVPGVAKVILTFRMQFYLPVHQCLLRKDFAIFPVGGRGKTPLPIIFLDMEIESDLQFWPQR